MEELDVKNVLIILVLALFVFLFLNAPLVAVTLLPYYFIYKAVSARSKHINEMKAFCLKQKKKAEAAELPDSITLMSIVRGVVSKEDLNCENLTTLVNFGCRLSLSNSQGRLIIDLEDPSKRPSYQIVETMLYQAGELFELPGARGRMKDCIGHYAFWRLSDAICFEDIRTKQSDYPAFLILFDVESLAPIKFSALKGIEERTQLPEYETLWEAEATKQ